MSKAKTRKSVAKRFKFTKTGKVLRRPTSQDHLRAKMSGRQRRRHRGWIALPASEAKKLTKALLYHGKS